MPSIKFSIYKLSATSSHVPKVGDIENDVIYHSKALQMLIDAGQITEPGRYLIVRHHSSPHQAEMQQYDVDFEKTPLKICQTIRKEIPSKK